MADISQKLENLDFRIPALPHLFKFLYLPSLYEIYLGMHLASMNTSPCVFSNQTKEGENKNKETARDLRVQFQKA